MDESARRCRAGAREFAHCTDHSMLQAPLLEASGRPAPHTATKLLVSHALTKLGSKAWEFATPLLLLRFSPGSLLAPTVFGLTIFLYRCAPARRARTRGRTSDSAATTRLRMTRPPPCIACPRHPAPTGAPVQRPAPTGLCPTLPAQVPPRPCRRHVDGPDGASPRRTYGHRPPGPRRLPRASRLRAHRARDHFRHVDPPASFTAHHDVRLLRGARSVNAPRSYVKFAEIVCQMASSPYGCSRYETLKYPPP